jgi:hypothetical protein
MLVHEVGVAVPVGGADVPVIRDRATTAAVHAAGEVVDAEFAEGRGDEGDGQDCP